MNSNRVAIKTSYFNIFGNFILTCIKIVSGIFGNSFALIADGIESLSDLFSSIIVLFGIRLSHKPADKNHPYGHGRIEPLITIFVVLIILISAFIIGYKSILNILNPHEEPKSWTLVVLFLIVVWKEISYRFVLKKSQEIQSSVLRAEAWHHRSDAITSILAFIGISIALIFKKGYESADDWAALIAVSIIFYNSYLMFRPAFGEIMDEHMYDDLVEQIRKNALEVPGILGTEKCFIRKTGRYYHIELHAIVEGSISVKNGHHLAHNLQDYLKSKNKHFSHIIVHIEPNN